MVALERGPARDTSPDFEYPRIADELRYGIRGDLWQPLAQETVTIRHGLNDEAAPYRRYGSFVLGNGVGGAGVHWNGQLWRASPEDLAIRSHYESRYGRKIIPEDMTIQDYGVTFDELERHSTISRRCAAFRGPAGNVRGEIRDGGNRLEGPRSDEFHTALAPHLRRRTLLRRRPQAWLNTFPTPSAITRYTYTTPMGCASARGICIGSASGSAASYFSKASPQTTSCPSCRRPTWRCAPTPM